MLDELVGQARRLFSSKSNGGRQVPQLTDRLHSYKQVLVALSIALLIGYAQFRDHFKCQGEGSYDFKAATNFCLMNGTTTVIAQGGSENDPHTGLGFQTTSDDKVVSHNYMRNYWYLLILIAVLSHLAQRMWASIFKNDMLKAILQLSGSADLRQVRAAEEAKPYEMLSSLSTDLTQEIKRQIVESPGEGEISRNEMVARRIALVDAYVNIYDHTLDYFPNQLIYLLLTKRRTAYKLSSLKMRQKLILYSFTSTLITIIQFVLALGVFGNEFLLYGWRYFIAATSYLEAQLRRDSTLPNSIDYELSSTLFPINTQCKISQYAPSGGIETFVVQCTIAINELGSKLFVFIWWTLVISIAIELWSLIKMVVCSLSTNNISLMFAVRFWPATREQADLIATFRHKRSMLIQRGLNCKKSCHNYPPKGDVHLLLNSKLDHKESDIEKKLSLDGSQSDEPIRKKWYMWCLRDICVALTARYRMNKRLSRLEQETEKDFNIYYLLYLLYLRLGASQTKIEEVIRMTACALGNYLSDLDSRCEEFEKTNEDDSPEDQNHVLKVC